MKTATRQRVVYAALVVAIIWGAYNLLGNEGKKPLPPVEVEAPVMVPTTSSAHASVKQVDLERIAAAGWGHDPFIPMIKTEAKPADIPKKDLKWVLTGIVFNERAPMAVINKRMVRAGDVIDDARVVAIERNSVQLEQNGKRFTLRVAKG